jgi:hypothetical protein
MFPNPCLANPKPFAISLLSQDLNKYKMLNHILFICLSCLNFVCVGWCVHVVLFLCYSLYGELRVFVERGERS